MIISHETKYYCWKNNEKCPDLVIKDLEVGSNFYYCNHPKVLKKCGNMRFLVSPETPYFCPYLIYIKNKGVVDG